MAYEPTQFGPMLIKESPGGTKITDQDEALKVVGTINATDVQIGGHQAIVAAAALFTEEGAGTYTGAVAVPAGAVILDIVVENTALWDAATSASMEVGDAADADGFYTAIDLKATDLLAGESICFALNGGVNGVYINADSVDGRYSATARTITGTVVSVGAGTAGRTRMVVIYIVPTFTAASFAA